MSNACGEVFLSLFLLEFNGNFACIFPKIKLIDEIIKVIEGSNP